MVPHDDELQYHLPPEGRLQVVINSHTPPQTRYRFLKAGVRAGGRLRHLSASAGGSRCRVQPPFSVQLLPSRIKYFTDFISGEKSAPPVKRQILGYFCFIFALELHFMY